MKRVVVGLQWGDEGKGKIVTYLSRYHDIVVRYSGGSNAGHTVVYPDKETVHHLIPSADLRRNLKMFIAQGVVVDPDVLLEELSEMEGMFPGSRKNLLISKQAHLVLSFHKEIDGVLDENLGIGTTRRGIGPSYIDRVARIGIRIEDLEDEGHLLSKLKKSAFLKERVFGLKIEIEKILKNLTSFFEEISENVIDTLGFKKTLRESSVLFEGTQGVLLDLDAGTYPFVTATNCSTTGVQTGVGFPVEIDEVVGVFKAYTTRVGEGPFPTEEKGEMGEELRRRGKEYGATTGRPRRCGWLDLPLLRYAVEVSGASALALTKVDVLSGMERIKVCVSYRMKGKIVSVPASLKNLENVEPVYEEIRGWKSLNTREFDRFLDFIEREVGCKIKYISTGPGVDEIVEIGG